MPCLLIFFLLAIRSKERNLMIIKDIEVVTNSFFFSLSLCLILSQSVYRNVSTFFCRQTVTNYQSVVRNVLKSQCIVWKSFHSITREKPGRRPPQTWLLAKKHESVFRRCATYFCGGKTGFDGRIDIGRH